MAADQQPDDTGSTDLIGRWLAHHEQRSTESQAPTEATSGTDDIAPAPRTPRRLPTAAVASAAVASDPMIGSRLAPPSHFGARRRPAGDGSLTAEPARQSLTDWEPIVMRSARKKTEQAEAKKPSGPRGGRSRLQRIMDRLVEPADPAASLADVDPVSDPLSDPDSGPVSDPDSGPDASAAPSGTTESGEPTQSADPTGAAPKADLKTDPSGLPPLPVRSPAPRDADTRSIEETIRASLARAGERLPQHLPQHVPEPEAEPATPAAEAPQVVPESAPARAVTPRPVRAFVDTARPAEPEPVADPDPVPASVVSQSEPELADRPDPVATILPKVEPEPTFETFETFDPDPDPEPDPEPPTEPGAAPALKRSEKPGARRARTQRARRSDGAGEPAAPTEPATVKARREPPRRRKARPGDAARDLVAAKARDRASQSAASGRYSGPVEVAAEMPGVYAFKPKRTSRRVLTLAFLAGLAASAYFVRVALQVRDTPAVGLAGIVVLGTAMVWAIRAGASVTRLTVRMGQLEVVWQGARFVFDMASEYTLVEVYGEPGRRGWKVLFPRRGMEPFAVDATMVDPHEFMRVLRYFRPRLVQR